MRLYLALLLLPVGVVLPAALSPSTAPEEVCARQEATYMGADSCKMCHFMQYRSWSKTRMAEAFETLKPGNAVEAKKKHGLDPKKDYTKDATCVPCHTTGYGKPGGYPALKEGDEWSEEEKKRAESMKGVQCEACHGPGSLTSPYKKDNQKYKREELFKRGMIKPDEENCKGCHNTKSPTVGDDYEFDYKALIKDPKKVHTHVKLKYDH